MNAEWLKAKIKKASNESNLVDFENYTKMLEILKAKGG
jgi:hypothetical protein